MVLMSGNRCQRLGRGFDSLDPLQEMNDLIKKKCVPCEGGISTLDLSEIHKYQKKVDGWDVKLNEKKYIFWKKNLRLKIF